MDVKTDEVVDNTQYNGQSTDTPPTNTNDNPKVDDIEMNNKLQSSHGETFGFKEKVMYLPSLFKYMVPITLVYFLEYFINQGLVSSFENVVTMDDQTFSKFSSSN